MHYDPIICMNVPDKITTKDAAMNKYKVYGPKAIVVIEAKTKESALRKYVKEYGVLASNIEQVNDSKTIDQAIVTCDEANYNDIKEVFNLLSQALQSSSDEKKWTTLVGKAQSKLLSMATKAKGF